MRDFLDQAIGEALRALRADHPALDPESVDYTVQPPKQTGHGDWASNVALVAAGQLELRDRRALAEQIVARMSLPGGIERVEIAGPGFLNFFVDQSWYQRLVSEVVEQDQQYGRLTIGLGQIAQVEFVSANPTGPLTVGHGRNAILGDTIARLYEQAGYQVVREYYFNNGGRQMRLLAESVRARYLEARGEPVEFPEDGYQGDYIRDIAASLGDVADFKEAAEAAMFGQIRATCERLGIHFDSYFNELDLYESGAIDRVVEALRERDLAYDQEGAVWLRGTSLGLPKDPAIIKSTGEPTYRLPDMAYHIDKLSRGYAHVIDIFGADHIDTAKEVLAAVEALGHDTSRVVTVIYQFVTLLRGGEQVKMSTRRADFVTLDELIDEVGADAVRYFFAMRSPNSHMEFDLDLAKKQAADNPMYYVQYGHARIGSILRREEASALAEVALDLSLLEHEAERSLIASLAMFPEVVSRALAEHEPHRLTTYAAEVATAFHGFYDRCPVLSAETTELARARLELCRAARIVLRNVLSVVGVSAPESM